MNARTPGPILEKSRPPVSVLDFSRDELLSWLSDRVAGRVEKAYLFGSVVDGSARPWSDLDVLLVADTDKPFIERGLDYQDLLDLGVAMDLLVYTPAEFERLVSSDSGFWRCFRERHLRVR